MIKIYGSMLCKDCVQCCNDFYAAGLEYEFLDFADSLIYLKEFLVLRERESVFASAIENGSIGIPCIVTDDGLVRLEWDSFIK